VAGRHERARAQTRAQLAMEPLIGGNRVSVTRLHDGGHAYLHVHSRQRECLDAEGGPHWCPVSEILAELFDHAGDVLLANGVGSGRDVERIDGDDVVPRHARLGQGEFDVDECLRDLIRQRRRREREVGIPAALPGDLDSVADADCLAEVVSAAGDFAVSRRYDESWGGHGVEDPLICLTVHGDGRSTLAGTGCDSGLHLHVRCSECRHAKRRPEGKAIALT
jgi:hypothetical protein